MTRNLGLISAMLCGSVTQDYLVVAWCVKVSYHEGRNKAGLPRNLVRVIKEFLSESFMELFRDDSHSICRHINKLFWAPHAG